MVHSAHQFREETTMAGLMAAATHPTIDNGMSDYGRSPSEVWLLLQQQV
jgi:hypothetical protein